VRILEYLKEQEKRQHPQAPRSGLYYRRGLPFVTGRGQIRRFLWRILWKVTVLEAVLCQKLIAMPIYDTLIMRQFLIQQRTFTSTGFFKTGSMYQKG
jgi:hypothetical protein